MTRDQWFDRVTVSGDHMSKTVKYLLAALVVVLAIYGGLSIISAFLTESRGKSAGKAMHPFLSGVGSALKEEAKQDLAKTPDEQLEKESYEISKKMYPIVKGSAMGQADAFINDPKRAELAAKMREVGKAFSKDLVVPLAEGLAEGGNQVFGSLDSAMEGVKKFQHENKDLVDAISDGIRQLKGFLEQNPPPQPPVPGSNPQYGPPSAVQPPPGGYGPPPEGHGRPPDLNGPPPGSDQPSPR
jgi:hypothetical protein